MWPDRVSNPGFLALETEALPTALRGPPQKDDNLRNSTDVGSHREMRKVNIFL